MAPPTSPWATDVKSSALPKAEPSQLGQHGFDGTDKLGFSIARAEMATFTAAQVDNPLQIGAAPAISN